MKIIKKVVGGVLNAYFDYIENLGKVIDKEMEGEYSINEFLNKR